MLTGTSEISYTIMAATDSREFDPDMQRVKVVFLGSQGVGKTSIIHQFVCQHFSDTYSPTRRPENYFPCLVTSNNLYEVKIVDCPMIPYFPEDSMSEWSDFRGYGLRSASAYVLVFDVNNDHTFHYIKRIREQLLDSLDSNDLPIVVVGNKHDLLEDRNVHRREFVSIVKKQWKCGYFECSAKYNWHITSLFKEAMRVVDCSELAHKQTSTRMQDALSGNHCVIL